MNTNERNKMPADINNPGSYAANEVPGWMEGESMQFLAEMAAKYPRVLEVGCWRGRSTLCLCEFACGHVWTVDTFKGTPVNRAELHREAVETPEMYLINVGATLGPYLKSGVLTVEVGESAEVAARMKASGMEPFDFLYIDADHETASVLSDIAAWKPLVRRGGLLAGHDATWPIVQAALNEAVPGWSIAAGCSWRYQIPE